MSGFREFINDLLETVLGPALERPASAGARVEAEHRPAGRHAPLLRALATPRALLVGKYQLGRRRCAAELGDAHRVELIGLFVGFFEIVAQTHRKPSFA